ncbi:MAG: 2-succinyl-5-enolpyruvyl-6-hydroxy-3-cyclohexene-1-carboxylic-acid synthase [Pleurocapsa sp. MO_192.B19]|nr:2-succinyl-5-enolpyruvyl-6-hydroxy-3-cyclohexene-1-carboxylic-acid synthase [Pleurocapsa sp. MO_192.B19]
MIDLRNVNTLWASVLVETLYRCGLTMAVICPGSRSTPLTVAFANHPHITTMPILDERSAAFFALGRAKKTGLPIVLVCTSGTAGANFYPAVIEAKESFLPLIIITADRPPELRNCHAGQTIDQLKLYGNLPNWQCELALPEADLGMLRYLRQNMVQAWEQSLFPAPGVVHINLPLREPLAPILQPKLAEFKTQFSFQDFFTAVDSPLVINYPTVTLPWTDWQSQSGIIIAGLAQPRDPQAYCLAIARLAKLLSFPVLAEALSPVRNYAVLNPYLISTYDSILCQDIAKKELVPEVVIQIGELPTSKQLRNWLREIPIKRWIIDPRIENFDPLHGKTIHIYSSIERVAQNIDSSLNNCQLSNYCQQWCELEARTRKNLDNTLESIDAMYEGKAAWLLSRSLPSTTPIFLANSMSVRNAEYFWQPNNSQIVPYFSRGANGIDGTLSTALGIAYGDIGVLLTGDLALLHDTNGFLIHQKFQGHLTIVVINNNGGGIFEMLPIANFASEFEEYFATPQSVNLAQLCTAYNIEHQKINNWQELEELLENLPTTGIRVLEITCDRHRDATWLKNNLAQFSV